MLIKSTVYIYPLKSSDRVGLMKLDVTLLCQNRARLLRSMMSSNEPANKWSSTVLFKHHQLLFLFSEVPKEGHLSHNILESLLERA